MTQIIDSSLGRDWSTADTVSMTAFNGYDPCWRVDVRWDDGAHAYLIYDSVDEALAHVRALGWSPSRRTN